MSIHTPFLVTVTFKSGQIMQFHEPTRSRAVNLTRYYAEAVDTTEGVTMYDGDCFFTMNPDKPESTRVLADAVYGTKVSWLDIGGRRYGKIAGGKTETKSGDAAYHILDEDGEWYVIPAWALTAEP